MHALLEIQKINIQRTVISLGMAFMEAFGFIMLICGILDIKIF